jgi:hypothetical protein
MQGPRQIFEDRMRLADLLLKVFRLLEHDTLDTEEALLRSLRALVKAELNETPVVTSDGIFLGLIRELAEVPPSAINGRALSNMLRQAVVTASAALQKRRNDIVHRADRSQEHPAGNVQNIGFPSAKQAVETIRVVCLAPHDLVRGRLNELKQQAVGSARR